MTESAQADDTKKPRGDYELYCAAISSDPVATVLRFHLLTEYYLEQLIRTLLPRGDRIVESGNYSYAQKLGIVEATDKLDDGPISALRNLNRLRNKCSHELNHVVNPSDLETIGSPLGTRWTTVKREHVKTEVRMNYLFAVISAYLSVKLERAEDALVAGFEQRQGPNRDDV